MPNPRHGGGARLEAGAERDFWAGLGWPWGGARAGRGLRALRLPRMRAPGAGSASVASLVLLWLLGLPWTWSTAVALGVYVGGGGWRFLRIVWKTARRDLL